MNLLVSKNLGFQGFFPNPMPCFTTVFDFLDVSIALEPTILMVSEKRNARFRTVLDFPEIPSIIDKL